mmetsp:Transcript_72116/g.119498  ORF Transcript_72116/g.119498 Transcript_72116/m.119498 type:complete len:112 (+) Transcript_72116:1-336(+)
MKAVTSWKEDRDTIPTAEFQEIVAAVTAIGFHAQLIYKTGPGDAWDVTEIPDVAAGHQGARRPAQTFNVTTMQRAAPIHHDKTQPIVFFVFVLAAPVCHSSLATPVCYGFV